MTKYADIAEAIVRLAHDYEERERNLLRAVDQANDRAWKAERRARIAEDRFDEALKDLKAAVLARIDSETKEECE